MWIEDNNEDEHDDFCNTINHVNNLIILKSLDVTSLIDPKHA